PGLAALVATDEPPELEEQDAALAQDILAAIAQYGVVKSEASETLAGVRAELQGARERLRLALDAMGRDPTLMLTLAPPAVVEHEGMLCLRVRPDRAQRLEGTIRGAARDGALLMEPERAQEAYSHVRRLEAEEHEAARRVVVALAERCAPRHAAL